MDGKSLDVTEDKLNNLKKILPEAFTEGKIDWEKLKAALGEDIEFKNERYVLNWAGKSDAFRVLQAPTAATLVPCKEESVDFDDTEHIFIEGENLEVLKILQKSYFSKVKMIYIDPPYNTGNDKFIYPDKFSETKEEYLSRIGDKDETGYMTREGLFRKNSKDSGHYHSNWLSMMYPRLFLARNLLQEDGVIFVSIDDNEVHNLRLLMNEIFGEENFIAQFVWQKKYSRDNRPLIGTVHEYIIMFAKNLEDFTSVRNLLPPSEESLKVYKNPNNDPRGRWRPIPMTAQAGHATKSQFYEITTPTGVVHKPPVGRCWAITKTNYEKLLNKGRIYFGKDNSSQPNIIRYLDEIEGFVPWTWLPSSEVGHTDSAMKEFYSIMGKEAAFETPKPSKLLKHFVKIATRNNDIILDFFSGTSTTAQAVLDINKEEGSNRKFILTQISEKCDEKSEAYKAGYNTIAEVGKERIRRVIKKIKTDKQTKLDINGNDGKQDLGFKVFKLQKSNFKIWRSDVNTEAELVTQLEKFTDPVDEKSKIENIFYELLLKSGIPLTAKIEEKENYYLANDGETALMLEKVDENIIKKVISEKPQKVITLDRLFKDNDPLKTNTALQMKDAEIDFRVV